MRGIQTFMLFAAALLMAACGGPPTQTLREAETAMNGAILAKKCAPDEYAAAERMWKKAQQLSDEERYDEAKAAALAAKKLADRAREKAQDVKADCLAPKAPGPEDLSGLVEQDAPDGVTGREEENLQTVYYDYNAFDLTPEARETMKKNAAWLGRNPETRVTIEGHCDSRGSTEFNLALGEKRAKVAKKYLKQLGVDVSTLSTLSYGEEQPLDYGEREASFMRNRRVEFTVR